MRKVPTTSAPMKAMDILGGFSAVIASNSCIEELEKSFAEYVGVKHCLAVNKGTAALYLAIMAMKKLSDKTEVILPAYTVPTLTLAMNMAGLKTKLCDISLETFNMEPESLKGHLSKKTLCVVPVHMFGFPCELKEIKKTCQDMKAFMLEDPAQAMGAELDGKKVGAYGDAALFSLCKGKVISTFSGGFAVTDNDELALLMRAERDKLPLNKKRFANPLLLFAFAFAMRPFIYGTMYPFIERFKSTEVHEHFFPEKYTEFQAAVGLKLLQRLDDVVEKRIRIGKAMYDALNGYDWIILPKIVPGSKPVFNHLPVVFKDASRFQKVMKSLWQRGIDTARMYMRPIHHIYDLGYGCNPDPFPNATYVAERLLTLPSHPYMTDADVEKIIDAFRKA
ncbi:MAG: DegT/DnrJ/EryC1/StrS family aminotransferase [Deltaproteobacteria bacterium]|nr:DegT/DnrJ/EryC1/StrS family aminotransferase [Deltaproteobacteria bacterium]